MVWMYIMDRILRETSYKSARRSSSFQHQRHQLKSVATKLNDSKLENLDTGPRILLFPGTEIKCHLPSKTAESPRYRHRGGP